MARGEGPANAVVTLGCAGWGAGQLESELSENSWLTVPADAELVFQLPLEQRWQGAASRIGVDLFRLTDYSGHVEPATPVPAPAVPAIRRDGTVLGFDVGSRRIGVAIGSAFARMRARWRWSMHGNGPDWTAIERLLKEWKPDGLVVGDPLTLDGQDQPNRKRAQGFARQLRERFKLPVVMIDERSSSVEAARRFAVERAEGRKRRRDAAALDAVAAAVIIDRWRRPRRRHPIP